MRWFGPLSLSKTVVNTVRCYTSSSIGSYGSFHKNHTYELRICAENGFLFYGKALHAHMLKAVPRTDLFLSNSLANMYSKCMCMEDACRVFDEITHPDVVSWNTIIGGYFISGSKVLASRWLRRMLLCGVLPDQFTLSGLLKGCISAGDLGIGLQSHALSIKVGLGGDAFVGSGLVEFYAQFNCLDELRKVSDGLVYKDAVFVNTMIGVLAKSGNLAEAVENFKWILASLLAPTRASFVNFLSAVDNCDALEMGMQIHGSVIKFGFESDGCVENSLVGMYANCDAMGHASDMLIYTGSSNVMSWTTLIDGYASSGFLQDAMELFCLVYNELSVIDNILLACILGVSATSECLDLGTQVHSIALRAGFESDLCVMEALMDMYAKCSSMEITLKIFCQINDHHSLFSWTTVISGFVHNGFPNEALVSFCKMRTEGVDPDSVACISALMACTNLHSVDQGEQIHAFIIKGGFETVIYVQTALLSLYVDGGDLSGVRKVFGKMHRRDVISWTALISGYTKLGYHEEAVDSLFKMLQEGVEPNQFTLASTVTACTKLTATEIGEFIHSLIIKSGFETHKVVGSALIDMYSKCGKIGNAIKYFKEMPKSDIVLWNALLAGYAQHGYCSEVLRAIEEMQIYGVEPDCVTFLAVLSGCSHGGFANEAIKYFILMSEKYQISPMTEHFSCIVDAFGRAGMFKEAVEFIEGMKIEPGIVILRTLLSSCIVHGCIQLGLAVAAKMIMLGKCDTGTYVLLSKLFSVGERWNDAKKVREVMETKCLEGKKVGRSWI
ncbi:pentatricopeptide repeat-containing protein At2g33680-like [Aristolochia californica]|uniref:pentatricopeptide repeat-containing protein At2g33680-like n=1 Tax=Aristolochia californica TaxID=171875 RepID=UPI0035D689FC